MIEVIDSEVRILTVLPRVVAWSLCRTEDPGDNAAQSLSISKLRTRRHGSVTGLRPKSNNCRQLLPLVVTESWLLCLNETVIAV